MTPPFLPLIDFYQELRGRGFELGVEEYQLLLDALGGGQWYPREDGDQAVWKDSLFRLCCTLWFKPNQSLKVFSELFEESWERLRKERMKLRLRKATPTAEPISPRSEERSEKREEREEKREEKEKKEEKKEERSEKKEEKEEAEGEKAKQEMEQIFVSYQSTKTRQGIPDEAHLVEQDRLAERNFLFTGAFLPLSKREMKLAWRYLRTQQELIVSDELDVPGMVDRFAQTGHIEPIFHRHYQYHSRLMVLIDRSKSMVAFGDFANTMAEIASKGDFGKVPAVYYFNEIPEQRLYANPQQTDAFRIREMAERFGYRKVDVMIISDGGAARGSYDQDRVLRTQRALKAFHSFADKIVWLNPMPEHRWYDSSADFIADVVPMFEASNAGLRRAIDVLRGKNNLAYD